MTFKKFMKKYKVIFLIMFIIDFFLPDPVPLVDEFILGIATIYGWL